MFNAEPRLGGAARLAGAVSSGGRGAMRAAGAACGCEGARFAASREKPASAPYCVHTGEHIASVWRSVAWGYNELRSDELGSTKDAIGLPGGGAEVKTGVAMPVRGSAPPEGEI